MRTRNSIYNIVGAAMFYATRIIVNFIGKTFLIRIMGDQYNGIAGLFTNVISMLSIAELGIGSAIIYNLYKPVKEDDVPAIRSIMRFYRRCYHAIAVVVLAAGLMILPFISSIVGEVSVRESIYVLYLFFLADAVSSYLFSYKRSLLFVYQKNYVINIFNILFNSLKQLLQVIALLLTHDFLIYLTVMVLCDVAENVGIQLYVNRHYPSLLDSKDTPPLDAEVKKDIRTKVKGLLFHNIGTYVVMGTDNILISRLIGIVEVGFYSNYNVVFGQLASILKQLVTAVQPSVGNLLVEKDCRKNNQIYKRIEFLNFWLYTVVSIAVYYVVQDFIAMWLGERYLFNSGVVFCLALNFWQTGMRNAPAIFKGAAGIYYEDRFVPVAESVINIAASVVLADRFGIAGIFMGTFISTLCVFFYTYPFLVFKRVLGKSPVCYFRSLLRFVLEWLLYWMATGIIAKVYGAINLPFSSLVNFIVKGTVIFLFVNMLLFIVHGRSDEFKYFFHLIHRRFSKKSGKGKI